MDRMENKGSTGEGEKQDDARIGLTAKYKAQKASGDRCAGLLFTRCFTIPSNFTIISGAGSAWDTSRPRCRTA